MNKFIKKADLTKNSEALIKLHTFSQECSYNTPNNQVDLFQELNKLKEELRFPSVDDDVGSFLKMITRLKRPKNIFEFGSGYGHSAFWFLIGSDKIQKLYLTERREDLLEKFESLSWPQSWKNKMQYFQGDAFEKLKLIPKSSIDIFLVDGEKATYANFVELALEKLNDEGVLIIDNAFWMGKFLDEEDISRSSQGVRELHTFLETSSIESAFYPVSDGILVLYPSK